MVAICWGDSSLIVLGSLHNTLLLPWLDHVRGYADSGSDFVAVKSIISTVRMRGINT